MGKNPSVAILAMGLAFCAFCHFFATCNADDASDLRKGIESLSKVMVKYRAELDNKVKFVKLQEAIDAIDEAMLGYQGKAKDKLPRVRNLNSDARLTYEDCVAPVFEWCISINSTFDIFIPHINDSSLSKSNKDMIWNITVHALNKGLEKTTKSLELLTNVQYKTAELKNLFQSILHDVHDDFGYNGYYGQAKADLEAKKADNAVARRAGIAVFIGVLYGVIGGLVFGPFGAAAGFAAGFAREYDIQKRAHWDQKKTYKEKIEAINHFFTLLTKKIEEATKTVKGMEDALVDDKTNLHKLRGVIEGANTDQELLLSEAAFLRAMYIPDIQILKDECTNYVNWHGYDDPFYKRTDSQSKTRRAASSFSRVKRSKAKDILIETASSNSTQFQTMNRIIGQIDC
ncbi:uncharacterized protein Dana_GF20379 [Drosophila ananassae]|uniref:Protein TsetseEP domain-containing protein n=1 Tax=Drosophila ananassae TaxID=7217 RepID=B3MQ53_DROAN|nr:uncharacterized protein LOC6503087 [Drosophila ananassae]EDV44479.2 uncharacterized protein Dana_GF20379 [Drosophila ananassae]